MKYKSIAAAVFAIVSMGSIGCNNDSATKATYDTTMVQDSEAVVKPLVRDSSAVIKTPLINDSMNILPDSAIK